MPVALYGLDCERHVQGIVFLWIFFFFDSRETSFSRLGLVGSFCWRGWGIAKVWGRGVSRLVFLCRHLGTSSNMDITTTAHQITPFSLPKPPIFTWGNYSR